MMRKHPKGLLVILSGPSGAGKGTVIRKLSEIRGDIRFSVSATTRAPRPGEEDGREYFFKTPEEFQAMVDAGEFLEYAGYVESRYGTPAAPVDRDLEAGYHVILDIEVQGAAQILEKRPEAVSVFLLPPSLEELERRLRGRGTDTEEKILKRLAAAREEYARAGSYRYIIINDDASAAAERLSAIITAETCRSGAVLEGDDLL